MLRFTPIVLFVISSLCCTLQAQQDSFWTEEITKMKDRIDCGTVIDTTLQTVVFTGSSSIKYWKDLPDKFQNYNIINTGFGGSKAYDVLQHLDDVILDYKPDIIFIYEGDNDLIDCKRCITATLDNMKAIQSKIAATLPKSSIYFISTKPSPARWYKKSYKKLNKKLERWLRSQPNSPM